MNETTITSDMYANKDSLLSVSTFLSLKQLSLLRETNKQVNSWLSDYSSFSWKKRIELSFPTTFKEVLKEDRNTQIDRLQKFDSLVDSGHQVSFFSLASLLETASVEVNAKYQVPWSRNLFVIVYNKTSAMVVDAETGKAISSNLVEMHLIDQVLFDIKNNKIGFVNKVNGAMKLFSLTDNSLKFESDFTCDKLKPSREYQLIPQIYGDYIIISKDYLTKLAWYSLSTGNQVKEIQIPGDDGIYIAPSQDHPLLYISATNEDTYVINTVDCTLEDEDVIAEEYSGYLGIEMDNCGDGVTGLKLTETEHGSVFNIYLMGTGDRAFKAVDLDSAKTLKYLHFGEWEGYTSIRYNPGSDFYSIEYDEVVAVMHSKEKYDDEKSDVGKEATVDKQVDAKEEDEEKSHHNSDEEKSDHNSDEEEFEHCSEEEEYQMPDPTKGAYFKFHSVQWSKWLNKDLFTVKSTLGGRMRQLFFSIDKHGIIGSIDDDIRDVFISENTLIAFTSHGDFYRVTLDMDFGGESEASESASEEPEETAANEEKDQVEEVTDDSINHAKKRKYSEVESDEDIVEELEAVPKKKQKVQA